jgi:hypothetical protein
LIVVFFSSVCPDSIDRANGQADSISPAPEGGESEEVHWDTQNNIICIRAEGGRKGGPGQEREKSKNLRRLENGNSSSRGGNPIRYNSYTVTVEKLRK